MSEKKMKTKPLTERQASLILIDQWFFGRQHPLSMDEFEMTESLMDFKYNVTEKRAEKIKAHTRKILEPFEDNIRSQVEKI